MWVFDSANHLVSSASFFILVCWGLSDFSSCSSAKMTLMSKFSPVMHFLEVTPVMLLGSTCLPLSFNGNFHCPVLPVVLSPKMSLFMQSVIAATNFLLVAESPSGYQSMPTANRLNNTLSLTLISTCKTQGMKSSASRRLAMSSMCSWCDTVRNGNSFSLFLLTVKG